MQCSQKIVSVLKNIYIYKVQKNGPPKSYLINAEPLVEVSYKRWAGGGGWHLSSLLLLLSFWYSAEIKLSGSVRYAVLSIVS